ncbi:DUF3604 domain-containing protein [Shimia sp.]|uniref:DUF3604 domain-containing protein n=1 Tax=Shimia sp. TaxID=1954381 RepID=UPI003297949F
MTLKFLFPPAMSAAVAAVALTGVPEQVSAQELGHIASTGAGDVEYSPFLAEDFPNQVLYGDTHLHTAYSADAGLVGAVLTPDDAYRFAKGEEITSSNGQRARLKRPLDWLAVTDHAENLGLPVALEDDDPVLAKSAWGRRISEIYAPRTVESRVLSYDTWMQEALNIVTDPLKGSGFDTIMWPRVTEAAERHNVPNAFTALIGYEWTSGPNGNNLHRNIIFRDGKDAADMIVPMSAYDSEDPEDLWAWMENYEAISGGQVLAIPHNGNLSNGLMFGDKTLSDVALDADYAKRRARWEPIYEITQIKGDGEAHPLLSPNDEFADYGTWDKGSFGPEPKTEAMLPREYARTAWQRGLAYEADLGVNPFKFGVVGSTDSHTGLSTAEESNFFGKVSLVEPTADPIRFEERITGRFTPDDPSDDLIHADGLASGLAAVWARENTREAIWDALKRKEVFATTGTRIRVRVFAGFDLAAADLELPNFARHGYENGVPMGGDLGPDAKGRAPTMLVRALRDPDGANLDRVQIVKGWVDASGTRQEAIYDVAWSDGRVPGADGRLPPVGNTVDPDTATYTNAIGTTFLQAAWTDPEFDAALRAFYYVRVLEIPTPRWTTYDAMVFGVDRPAHLSPDQQERAYSSPIWYTPAKG